MATREMVYEEDRGGEDPVNFVCPWQPFNGLLRNMQIEQVIINLAVNTQDVYAPWW